jgi:DNA-binding transcriptional LysR family regulator
MERARMVAQLWDWLPAFRAVAETEHLPTAATAMRLSPSTLSRAVGLLEDAVGHPLFERTGRRIVLNDRGALLLEAVRDAMRGVHSALEFIDDELFVGPVRVSVPLQWLGLVIPSVTDELASRYPGLVVEAVALTAPEIPIALRQGAIDVGLADGATRGERLVCDLVREYSLGVYVSSRHPLGKQHRPSWKDVAASEYVAIGHYGSDVWQLANTTPRVRVDDLATAAQICERRRAITVIPDALAKPLGLTRLHLTLGATTPLYLLHRPTLTIPGRTEAVVNALRATLKPTPGSAKRSGHD